MVLSFLAALSVSITSAIGSYNHGANVSFSESGKEHFHSLIESGIQIMDATQVTILTHGMGGSYLDWWESEEANGNISELLPSLITNRFYVLGAEGIKYTIDINGNSFTKQSYEGLLNITTSPQLDISKHLVIIYDGFDDTDSYYSNDDVYLAFERSIDSLLGSISDELGVIPKINLIGHSRGGITNMKYAIEHPQLVSNVMSVGTPYFGTDWGEFLVNSADIYDFFSNEDGRLNINGDAYTDLFYSENSVDYRYMQGAWNALSDEYGINSEVVSVKQTLPFLKESIKASLIEYGLLQSDGNNIEDVFASIDTLFDQIYNNVTRTNYNIANWILNDLTKNVLLLAIENTMSEELSKSLIKMVVDLFSIKGNDLDFYDNRIQYVDSDILVETRSQKGKRNVSGNQTYAYNFQEHTYVFDAIPPYQYRKTRDDMPSIAHNLETKCPGIISYFVDALELDTSYLHSHSFNLGFDVSNHFAYCNCGAKVLNNNHEWQYSVVDNSMCRRVCQCGYFENVAHSISYSDSQLTTHTESCINCGYTTSSVQHRFNISSIKQSYHVKVCACGYEKNETHRYNSANRCTICGYIKNGFILES